MAYLSVFLMGVSFAGFSRSAKSATHESNGVPNCAVLRQQHEHGWRHWMAPSKATICSRCDVSIARRGGRLAFPDSLYLTD